MDKANWNLDHLLLRKKIKYNYNYNHKLNLINYDFYIIRKRDNRISFNGINSASLFILNIN